MEEERRETSEETTEAALQKALAALEQSNREAEAAYVAREQAATLTERWQAEVEGYKEQSQQYAITIVAMEERLSAALEEQRILQSENESLKQQLTSTTADHNSDSSGAEDEHEAKVMELEDLTKALRHQLALASREGEQQQKMIQSLKEDVENHRLAEDELRAQHDSELEDVRKTLSLQENELEHRREEVGRLQRELDVRQAELSSLREGEEGKEKEMRETYEKQLQTQLMEAKERWQHLIAVGERCLGEHHSQVLARQRDSIAHLREKVKERDSDHKPSGHVATLAELERVREELVEERALRHLEAGGVGRESDSDSTPESDPVLDALQHSEDSYFCLVASVCEAGLVKARPVERRMPVDPSPAGRASVTEERKKFAEKVGEKIRAVVRDVEEKLKRESGESESDDGSLEPNLGETVAQLQSELETAAEELDQQRRVNLALVKRQEFREQQMRNAIRFRKSQKLLQLNNSTK